MQPALDCGRDQKTGWDDACTGVQARQVVDAASILLSVASRAGAPPRWPAQWRLWQDRPQHWRAPGSTATPEIEYKVMSDSAFAGCKQS